VSALLYCHCAPLCPIKALGVGVNHWHHPAGWPGKGSHVRVMLFLNQLLGADCSRPGLPLGRQTQRKRAEESVKMVLSR